MITTDYTLLAIGTKIDRGEILICPDCGRPGLAEEIYGKTYFTHSQSAGVNNDGDIEMASDECPKETPKTESPK
jgi:hypothetical protein